MYNYQSLSGQTANDVGVGLPFLTDEKLERACSSDGRLVYYFFLFQAILKKNVHIFGNALKKLYLTQMTHKSYQ